MELLQAMKERHSVRSYSDRPITGEVKDELIRFIEECNNESGLHMQLILNEPKAFSGLMAHYGKFSGVKNYIALIGKKGTDLDEKCGYYGEKVVLKAQQLGLNTCWVATTYSKVKTAFKTDNGEKLCVVIAVGYGLTQGTAHKSKPAEKVTDADYDAIFTKDKPIIFNFHGYPTLVHELTYTRRNKNLHVFGYIEEGTITTPFDMRVQNKIDRFDLVKTAITVLPQLGNKGSALFQKMNDLLVKHKNYIAEVGEDIPEVKEWVWHTPESK